MLSIRSLRKVYDGQGRTVEALKDISFTVEGGQFVCVVGPSGCGKTTLLRCLGGLLRPTSGEVQVAGKPVSGPPDDLAIVFQEYGRSLFPWMKVGDNVELPLKAKGLARPAREALVRQAQRGGQPRELGAQDEERYRDHHGRTSFTSSDVEA